MSWFLNSLVLNRSLVLNHVFHGKKNLSCLTKLWVSILCLTNLSCWCLYDQSCVNKGDSVFEHIASWTVFQDDLSLRTEIPLYLLKSLYPWKFSSHIHYVIKACTCVCIFHYHFNEIGMYQCALLNLKILKLFIMRNFQQKSEEHTVPIAVFNSYHHFGFFVPAPRLF